ncbi:glycosyltransferase [Pseudomonas sp. fls2-241-R2A-110]|jgi:glycosyltransferase involved in cell wall biosynthesis|uniref:glycosyltransferase n=1 Tax=Pseudomonas sp. fls2-241-R2A-110 TaxID=3040311 RepID=UPI0025527F1D|nr:glycosyltransferase [Pseudomonas sp. fls2-241-R2A-110]
MDKVSMENGIYEPAVMSGDTITYSTMSDKFFIDSFKDEHLNEDDKLALLNFLMREFALQQPLVLKGTGSGVEAQFLLEQFSRQNKKIDLFYLDAQALQVASSSVITKLFDLLSRKGVICIEAGSSSVEVDRLLAGKFKAVLETPDFLIFAQVDGDRPIRSMRYQVDLFRRKLSFDRKRQLALSVDIDLPLVTVIVLTFKHESFIAECLQSVLHQKGRFRLRVVIIDDASPDGTAQIVNAFISDKQYEHLDIAFHANQQNVGVVANLATALRLAEGCDYLTFCEGDDFWSSENRVQEHIDFLSARPKAVMSFNTIELCAADGLSRKVFADHENLVADGIDGVQLAENNLIGNFSACFYHGALISVIPRELFQFYTVDWFFNLYCAQFGTLAHLKKPLSIYRQHGGGEWSARRDVDKITTLLEHISDYNAFLDFSYDEGFQEYSNKLYCLLDEKYSDTSNKLDLVVFDDVFPSTRSGFRYTEFTSYLRAFEKSLVLTSGASLPVLEDTPIKDVVRSYQRQYPELGSQVMIYNKQFPLRLGKLLYVNFLTNAYALLPYVEAERVPFVFTLYPGAGFVLNNPDCDRKLKQVFDSPCFQKVIVTQQVTYDYIVHRNLCPAEKVQMIFGVVMPENRVEQSFQGKSRWGLGKSRLDICFMAHKYTAYGEDKGYDVFVNVASILRQRHDDIYFHVVGPFDRRVIDVSTFSDRITFHGSLNPDQFDAFFSGMDIIMSPNISGKIFPGSFDGFPTASCTEAGLRGIAIFAIDEFNSASGRFTDGEDIVLIRYDLMAIVDKVESYYSEPDALRELGERGAQKIRELYSLDAQMTPRIELLQQVIIQLEETPLAERFPFNTLNSKLSVNDETVPADILESPEVLAEAPVQTTSLLWNVLRKICPGPIKKLYRMWKGNYASN